MPHPKEQASKDVALIIDEPMKKWPVLLPMHIAEYETNLSAPLYTMEEIADHFGLTIKKIEAFKRQKSFRAEVHASIKEVKDSSSVIRRKAKAQLEMYLDVLIPQWMSDPEFPPTEKVKMFQFLAKTARIVDDPTEQAKAEAKLAVPEKSTTLNLYLQTPSGETTKMTGVTINQEAEKLVGAG